MIEKLFTMLVNHYFFDENDTCMKKQNDLIVVTMGAYDSAEVCELV